MLPPSLRTAMQLRNNRFLKTTFSAKATLMPPPPEPALHLENVTFSRRTLERFCALTQPPLSPVMKLPFINVDPLVMANLEMFPTSINLTDLERPLRVTLSSNNDELRALTIRTANNVIRHPLTVNAN